MRTPSGADRSGRQRLIVWLVWGLCGLVVALVASALLLQAPEPRPVGVPELVQDALLVALAIPVVVVGALISVHRPGNRVGALLLAGALALSVFSFLENYFGYVAHVQVSCLTCGRLRGSRAGRWRQDGARWCSWSWCIPPGGSRRGGGVRWPGRWQHGHWGPRCS